MSKVHILPNEVISRIAAGEVIERPTSVVKELLENSLDAESTDIKVELKDGGKTYIKVKDNGIGVEPDDIEKIFLRHATSKIKKIEDLYTIFSLGFRGEALYSISSVSDIVFRSKTVSSDIGWEIHLRGGKKISLKPINMEVGTEIEVKELFFNTPVRRKFLKSNSVELNYILNIFIPYTFLYFKNRFSLKHNNKVLLELYPEENPLIRISKVLNLEKDHIIDVKPVLFENISIHILLGDINIKRAKKDMQFIFVNNRPVQNKSLSFTINKVYEKIFPKNVYPFFTIFLNLPPEKVDVNIHPTKREVKIEDEFNIVSKIGLFCEHTILSLGKPKQVIIPFKEEKQIKEEKELQITEEIKETQEQYFFQSEKENLISEEKYKTLKDKLSHSVYIGSFINKYLIFSSEESLLLMDQHAVCERITYEKFKQQINEGKIQVQNFLTPILLKLSIQEMIIWQEGKKKLEEIGFETTLWDKETIAVHSSPTLIKNPEISIRSLLSGENISNYDTDTIAKLACRQSVMAGQLLTEEEALFLRNELLLCKEPFVCPHGRPTVVEISEKFIDKQFLRI